MEFFTYHMPSFLSVMGLLYVVVATPFILGFLVQGYWAGVLSEIWVILRTNYLSVVLVMLLTLGLITWVDLPLTQWVKQVETFLHMYTFWDFICACAEGGFIAGVMFSGFILADYFKLTKLAAVSKISLMSSILGGLINGGLKFLFNRQRPAIGLEQWHFFAFFQSGAKHIGDLLYAYNSMPSGHTISTLAAITPFWLAYKSNLLRAILAGWALMVCFSRIYTLNHWLSDVTLAAIIGSVIGLAVYRVNQRRLIYVVK